MVRLQPDPFLNELTNMFERTTEKGSVWVTLKHSSDKSKVKRNKMKTAGEKIEFKCLIRATDGKKTISTMLASEPWKKSSTYEESNDFLPIENTLRVNFNTPTFHINYNVRNGRAFIQLKHDVGPKDHQRFQSSYATILKARMTALKKRERKDKRKTADSEKKQDQKKQSKASN